MPWALSKFRLVGPTVSHRGCPDSESLTRFPKTGSWVELELVTEARGTTTGTLLGHTSNTHQAFLPVVGVEAVGVPHGTQSGTLSAYRSSKHLEVLPGDAGNYCYQPHLLSQGSGSGHPSPAGNQIH